VKASKVLQEARALVRKPYTAVMCLVRAASGSGGRAIVEIPGFFMLDWARSELPGCPRHDTVKGQRANYDVAISMALSDEAGE
jgi:hypothetical protein